MLIFVPKRIVMHQIVFADHPVALIERDPGAGAKSGSAIRHRNVVATIKRNAFRIAHAAWVGDIKTIYRQITRVVGGNRSNDAGALDILCLKPNDAVSKTRSVEPHVFQIQTV